MEERVFGAKGIWTPKIFAFSYFILSLALVFSVFFGHYLFSISIFSSLLFLRVLYEFFMSSFKATEHLCRIADAIDSKISAKEE